MVESKSTADQRTQQRREDAAEKKAEAAEKTEANKRQEAEKDRQAEDAKKSQARAKVVDSGKGTAILRDDAESTEHDVKALIAQLGGEVKSSGKGKVTFEAPEGSERQTDSLRQKLVEHLIGSPLVESVE